MINKIANKFEIKIKSLIKFKDRLVKQKLFNKWKQTILKQEPILLEKKEKE